ncbi:MAG: T9SS type A sorting domain-containing protein, partial [Bacteroidia bacterium]|nr:T9SS type A sorting domain-containing protein [Bacteroidia bacterium]
IYEANKTVVYTITSSQGGGAGDTLWNLAFTVGGQSAGCTNAITTAQFMIIDAVALPVTLIEFNAEEQSGYNYLNWVVAEEENVQKYIVEYGHNGKDFAVVAEISYDVTAGSSYFYNHLVAEDVVSYYRLSVADINGNITPLSQVKGVNQSIFSTFNIYPNPGKGAFTANFTSSKQLPVSFIVTDAFGKTAATLETLAVKGNNNIVFDLAGKLENGMYFVTYNYGTSKGTVKISIIN